jgi:iron complex outermembrane receptor protein
MLKNNSYSSQNPVDEKTTPTSTKQSKDDTQIEDPKIEEVTITGTLIRGTAPIGTNVISLSRNEIDATGAMDTNDVLATVPQLSGYFGTIPFNFSATGAASPKLRDLPGNSTLNLLDGHRIVGAGITDLDFDPTIIPPGILERIDVVPDGGSSIYGADAVGGVINYITRKKFEGFEASGKYALADSYNAVDANITSGHNWEGGAIFASLNYAWHDNIPGTQRDFVTSDLREHGGTDFRSVSCAPGNIAIDGVTYGLPERAQNVANLCDRTDGADYYPREERYSLFAGGKRSLSETLALSIEAIYSRRLTTLLGNADGANDPGAHTITSSNPYFSPIGAETSQTVFFSYGAVLPGNQLSSAIRNEVWGISPSLTLDMAHSWQLRAEINYSESAIVNRFRRINAVAQAAALSGTTLLTALNPYDLSLTAPTVLQSIFDFENVSKNDISLGTARTTFDGPLFAVSGGDVRLAAGVEYIRDETNARGWSRGPGSNISAVVSAGGSRHTEAVFGELVVPVIGNENAIVGARALELSASIRRDDYSDFGETTNPKFGLTYKPLDSVTIRGNYGTSFTAPSLADTHAVDSRVVIVPVSPWRQASSPDSDLFRPTPVIAGGNPDLDPQTADIYSIGADLKPAAIGGLIVSATYWNVKFENLIDIAPFFDPAILYSVPALSRFYTLNPTITQIQDAIGNLPIDQSGLPSVDAAFANGITPYVLIDARRNNIAVLDTDGVDFNLEYSRPTNFGSIQGSVAGTYVLNRDRQFAQGTIPSDELETGFSRFSMLATLGARVGKLSSRATLVHRSGYPIVGALPQTHIKPFDVVDLYFSYALEGEGEGWAKDWLITLNIDNIFDENPPWWNGVSLSGLSNQGYINGSTLGRSVALGVRKMF